MQGDVIELSSMADWLLGVEQVNGQLVADRLFLVTELLSSDLPNFEVQVTQINHLSILGRGYVLESFEEPCMGCEVLVQPGWELTSAAMRDDFLKRFIKALESELGKNARTNR